MISSRITAYLTAALVLVAATGSSIAAERVAEIRVEGNRRVETSAIRVHIDQSEQAALDEDVVNSDIKAIYAMGFFDNVWVTSERTPAGTLLVYYVTERPYVERITFEGVDEVDVEDLEALVNVTPRTIFDPQRAWLGVEEARKFYTSEGYPDATIEFELEVDDDNNAELFYYVEEGKLIRVQDIRLEGVQAFKRRKLRKLMTTRTEWFFSFVTGAGLLNEDELATDVERLTAFYYDNGYIHARVDEPRVERVGDGLVVTIKIEEGPLFHVGDIDFAGDILMSEDELRARLGFAEGDVFRASGLRDAIFSLTEAYGDLGYAFAEAVPQTRVDPSAEEVDVSFQFTSGPVVNIRRIDIRGNTKTRDHVIRRELALQEGEKFSGSGLRRSKRGVNRLGFFEEVELTTNRTESSDEVDLLVQVKEGRTGSFSAGAGFSSGDNLLFNARVAEQNLFGRAQRLVLNADFGSVRQNLQFSLTEPWFRNIPLAVGIDLFRWQLEFDRFTRAGTGFALRASYPLRRLGLESFYGLSLNRVRAGLAYRLENAEIEGVSQLAPPDVRDEEGKRLTSSITPTLVRNTLDHPFDPTTGSRQAFSAELAGLGGESDFFKLELSGRWFFPMWTVLGGRQTVYSIGGSVAYGLGDSGESGEELPVFERYFPGGINSVRGFETRELGPTQPVTNPRNGDEFDEEVGGSQQLIVNNEIIVPIIPDAGLKGVVFFDVGNAFLAEDGINFGDMRYAAGFGVRWLSPFGPLRVEIGYPLDKKEGESSSVVLFSFGAPL